MPGPKTWEGSGSSHSDTGGKVLLHDIVAIWEPQIRDQPDHSYMSGSTGSPTWSEMPGFKKMSDKLHVEETASFNKAKHKKMEMQENNLLTEQTIEQKKQSEIS
ncbi:hypothetical protein TREES_T100003104 [Tupaia chinensis]|uniref:Uncharacterized protein n=1 Tax=Tupaia chinensis TaxID=246437 RepID=L9KNE8_TUPCH|nr:hypothetical protein TREES_T100003104 [Tupaia chinensis]